MGICCVGSSFFGELNWNEKLVTNTRFPFFPRNCSHLLFEFRKPGQVAVLFCCTYHMTATRLVQLSNYVFVHPQLFHGTC